MTALAWPLVALCFCAVLWRGVSLAVEFLRIRNIALRSRLEIVEDSSGRHQARLDDLDALPKRLSALEDRLTALDQRAPPSIAKPDPMARFRR